MLNLSIFRTSPAPVPVNKTETESSHTLAQVRSGSTVTIQGFDGIVPAHRQHLQAYGVLPGRSVQVLSQRPVTIILSEQTELAFENEIASQVLVQ